MSASAYLIRQIGDRLALQILQKARCCANTGKRVRRSKETAAARQRQTKLLLAELTMMYHIKHFRFICCCSDSESLPDNNEVVGILGVSWCIRSTSALDFQWLTRCERVDLHGHTTRLLSCVLLRVSHYLLLVHYPASIPTPKEKSNPADWISRPKMAQYYSRISE